MKFTKYEARKGHVLPDSSRSPSAKRSTRRPSLKTRPRGMLRWYFGITFLGAAAIPVMFVLVISIVIVLTMIAVLKGSVMGMMMSGVVWIICLIAWIIQRKRAQKERAQLEEELSPSYRTSPTLSARRETGTSRRGRRRG